MAPRAYPCHPSLSIRSNVFAEECHISRRPGRWTKIWWTKIRHWHSCRRNGRMRGRGPADRGAGRTGRGNGEPDRPATEPLEAGRRRSRLIVALLMASPLARACAGGGLVARIGAPCRGHFRPILGACCRSSVVEHSIGNGEVDSSILSGSTIFPALSPFGPRYPGSP